MTETPVTPEGVPSIAPGDVVYTDDGEAIGVVTGVTGDGVEVEFAEKAGEPDGSNGAEPLDAATRTEHPGQQFGEGYLAWRCDECGEMGDLEGGCRRNVRTAGHRRKRSTGPRRIEDRTPFRCCWQAFAGRTALGLGPLDGTPMFEPDRPAIDDGARPERGKSRRC
ncbi:MAG: hypothetical protein ACI91T_002788 [Natronomonas sp.]|jgi:hypothetical protein